MTPSPGAVPVPEAGPDPGLRRATDDSDPRDGGRATNRAPRRVLARPRSHSPSRSDGTCSEAGRGERAPSDRGAPAPREGGRRSRRSHQPGLPQGCVNVCFQFLVGEPQRLLGRPDRDLEPVCGVEAPPRAAQAPLEKVAIDRPPASNRQSQATGLRSSGQDVSGHAVTARPPAASQNAAEIGRASKRTVTHVLATQTGGRGPCCGAL
jgi:hypothetical protein